jgi:flagellar protein FliJ
MGDRAFKFRLERVRALRAGAEDQAKEELAASLAERRRWAERLGEAAVRLEEARRAQAGAASSGTSAAGMLAHQAYLERSEREERTAELDLHRKDAEVDSRRGALREAARERQVLERLKERQATQHRLAAERREGAELDELAITRHRRRRA